MKTQSVHSYHAPVHLAELFTESLRNEWGDRINDQVQKALKEIANKHSKRIFGLRGSRQSDFSDWEDLSQEAIIKLDLEKFISRIKGKLIELKVIQDQDELAERINNVSFWVDRYIRNRVNWTFIDELRKFKLEHQSRTEVEFDKIIDDSNQYDNIDREILLEKMSSNLSEEQVRILKWRYADGFTIKEIEDLFKIPHSTVHRAIKDALSILMENFKVMNLKSSPEHFKKRQGFKFSVNLQTFVRNKGLIKIPQKS